MSPSFLLSSTPARRVELPQETFERLRGERLAVAGSVHRARNSDRRIAVEALVLHGLVVACLIGLVAGAVLLGMRP